MIGQELKVAKEVLEYFSSDESSVDSAIRWALIYEDQSFNFVNKDMSKACFGGLSGQPKGSKYFVFWNFARRKYGSRYPPFNPSPLTNYEKKYIRYIVKDSIFSPCFHTKNVNEIFESGCIMNTDMPAQFVYSAASSIRYVSESPHIPEMWSYFRKYISDDESLVLSHLFYPKKIEDKTIAYSSRPMWSNQHGWMVGPSYFGKNEFKRFCDRDLKGLKGLPSFSQNSNFSNVTKIWREDSYHNLSGNQKFTWPRETDDGDGDLKKYNFENLEKDIKAMLEVNCVNT